MRSLALALALVVAAGSGRCPASPKRGASAAAARRHAAQPAAAAPAARTGPARCARPACPAPTARRHRRGRPRRSWLGPIAGLAAGLGLAALMSHLGFGAEFGNCHAAAARLRRAGRHPLRDAPLQPARAVRAAARGPAPAARMPCRRRPATTVDADRRRCRAQRRRPPSVAAPARRRAAPRCRRLRRAGIRAHRQADLHPHAGRQRRRRPGRPARVHDARDVRVDQARPAGPRQRSAADRVVRSMPRCSTSPARPSARRAACVSTA